MVVTIFSGCDIEVVACSYFCECKGHLKTFDFLFVCLERETRLNVRHILKVFNEKIFKELANVHKGDREYHCDDIKK